MKKIKADLLVIGAGSGGLVLASGAAQLGANVVLVEGDRMGGDCLNSVSYTHLTLPTKA
mgnify:CR=1 FL=1